MRAWDDLLVSDVSERNLVRHVGRVYDSSRWEGFALRPDDIVISTPPKCGTTWTQMICALLVFQTPELPDRLSNLSPWLDMLTRSRATVVALLEAQEHRRFIKTHTPLSGIPVSDGVTYICVGRDPRDVALSMDDHLLNLDWEGFHAQCVAAALEDGRPEPAMAPPPPLESLTERERFWQWVDDQTAPTESSSSLLRTVRHIESFWEARDTVNVVMLHYHDLTTDLEAQMRALAATTRHRGGRGTVADARRRGHVRLHAARQRPNGAEQWHLEGRDGLLQARPERRMARTPRQRRRTQALRRTGFIAYRSRPRRLASPLLKR